MMSLVPRSTCPTCGRLRQLLSIRAAAEIAGVTRKTIYRWLKAGLLEYRRLPSSTIRILRDSLLGGPRRGNRKAPGLQENGSRSTGSSLEQGG